MRALYIVVSFFFFSQLMNAQQKPAFTYESFQDNIAEQLTLFPQEKIHLHTDRNYYVPGENIWFKAYLVDAMTNFSPTKSRYVYVELISPGDTLISRVMIRPDEKGMHYGHIFLSEVIPEGYYTLRAYSRYMENTDEGYFFKKNIRIGNLASETEARKMNTKQRKPKDDYEVSFFPEGGNMPEGSLCRVAFKALTNKGDSESIKGEIVDEEGTPRAIVETDHAGMGIFSLIPEEGKKYYLDCSNSKGQTKRFQLPPAMRNTRSLLTYWRDKKLLITQLMSTDITDKPEAYLLIHNKGNVLYFNVWDYSRQYVSLAKEQLPTGVIQILLFDGQMNPLSERLVFNKNIQQEMARYMFETNKEVYGTRELISSQLKVTDTDGLVLLGNLSVSITDDKDITVGSESILTSLLLTSELKGNIESPGYYFEADDERRVAELDLLMMTHGWRRYNIPEVVKGNYSQPEIPFEESQQIAGTIKSLFLSKPIANSEITIFTSATDIAQTESDENGRFLFTGYEYPDSTTYFIQSLGKKGSNRVELVVDKKSDPPLKHLPFNPVPAPVAVADTVVDNAFMEKAEQRAQYNEDMRIVHLKNIDVVASLKKKKEENLPWYTLNSDMTIGREKIEERNPMFVSDLLYMVPGVRVHSNGAITMRGMGSIMGGSLPLILIDGMSVEWPSELMTRYDSPLEMVSIHDVERIDVFKGAQGAIFGMRGANGAISITTCRGEGIGNRPTFNHLVLTPLGYQKPVEFYSPQYDTPELKHTGLPDYRTTLLWKPDIITDENGEAMFNFYTSDFTTTYSVVIEGITTNGKIVYGVEKIKVE